MLTTIALAGAFLCHKMKMDSKVRIFKSMAGHELEVIALQALEEAHYRLAAGGKSLTSPSAARALIAAAMRPSDSFSVESDELPPNAATSVNDNDTCAFLRDAAAPVYIAPLSTAATLVRNGNVELGPVEVRVIDREAGKQAKVTVTADKVPTGAELAAAGLPPLLSELRTVWGVLEFSCELRVKKGRSVDVYRRVAVRKLYTEVDFAYIGEPPRRYGYIFPEAIGQTLARSKSWGST